jgi:hypothetical protein
MSGNSEELKLGSVGVSPKAHAFLVTTVFTKDDPTLDAPFTSIVEAFRFAFALGFSKNKKMKKKAGVEAKTVAPRQFTVMSYVDILENEIDKEYKSLGGLASAYAEAGADLMMKTQDEGKSVLSLLD